MSVNQVLDYLDPRLGMQILPARYEDVTTQAAIRILTDNLSGSGHKVLAAPALGLPVRVLGIRMDDIVHCLLNPSIAGSGSLFLSRGETTPHTGRIQRDVMRLRSLTVEGSGAGGNPVRLELDGDLAPGVQQAFDLLDMPVKFGWMTGFHHHWMRMRDKPVARRYEMVSANLYATPPSEYLTFVAPNRRALCQDGVALCEIDALNPIRPHEPRDRLIMALMLKMTGMRTVFVTHPGQFGLVLAMMLAVPGLVAHICRCGWPMDITRRLGLTSRQYEFGPHDFPESPQIGAELDGVIIDTISAPNTPLPGQEAIRNLARNLSGNAGALIVALPAESPDFEALLQRNFAAVYLYPAPGGVIYLARKTAADVSLARTRLSDAARKLLAPWLWEQIADGGLHLRKDQKRVPL